jgi:transposase
MDKNDILRKMGALNKNPLKVRYTLFIEDARFFDPHDKLQVKYEMLRAVEVDGLSITEVAKEFGYSRETYYTVARDFELEGCIGLLDQFQGRRQPEKLQSEVVEFIFSERYKDPVNNSGYRLVEKIYNRFHVKIHPRTIYKVLKKLK